MTIYMRALCERTQNTETGSGPIRFVASTEGKKQDGKDLKVDHWDLENYAKNPVFLWVHDYMGRNLPIGKAQPTIEGKQLIADVTFDPADEFARQVEGKYRRGYLNAVSVGWDDYAKCPNCGAHITGMNLYASKIVRLVCSNCGEEIPKESELWFELLDISGVPVPIDPDALIERQYRALKAIFEGTASQDRLAETGGEIASQSALAMTRGERPYPNEHACRLRDPGDFEDGSFVRVEREHEGKKYSVIQGRLKGETTLTDQAYRYPKDTWTVESARAHCKAHDGKIFEPAKEESYSEAALWNGVASAMLALYRDYAALEEEDRKYIYNQLEKVYRKMDRTPPEYMRETDLALLCPMEIDGLFLEGEAVIEQPAYTTEPSPGMGDGRVGAVLNARNKKDLEQAVELVQGGLKSAEKAEPDGSQADGGQAAWSPEMVEQLEEINLRLHLFGQA
jgi:hypothetical protein